MSQDPQNEQLLLDAKRRYAEERNTHMHPLELIPFFRRWPRTEVRDLLYTAIFSLLIMSTFLVFGFPFMRMERWADFVDMLVNNLIVSMVIGFTWHFFTSVLRPLLRRLNTRSFPTVIAAYTVMGFGITQIGFYVVTFLPGFAGMRKWMLTTQWFITTAVVSFVISLVLGLAWRSRIAGLMQEAALARERERLEAAERATVQANLRALQAQIEPHFLFNTLANVVGLIHPEPALAKRMLEEFIVYLRATLAATREDETTLGRDFELMKSFLAVLQIRMGERLTVAFDLPPELAGKHMPPMLLQPLVENAIKHGLEPYIDGGLLTLSAKAVEGGVAITVADTGVGFGNTTSGGVGLKNVRERLEKLYGDKARLTVEDNAPSGTRGGARVTITLPI